MQQAVRIKTRHYYGFVCGCQTYNAKVTHIFLVRGHSFDHCDRNFSDIRSALKTLQDVEEPKRIWNGFLLVDKILLHSVFYTTRLQFLIGTKHLRLIFLKTTSIKDNVFIIQQYHMLHYKSGGELPVTKTYHSVILQFGTPKRFLKS